MEYRVLGPLEVRDGDESLPLAGAKQRGLLALLLVHANHVLSRDRLIDELWGDHPPETAVQSLQVYVSRLRKLLPDGTLLTRPPGYLLEIDPDTLDLHRFERLLADGREALAEGDAERASSVLREALELWRGPALAEFAFEPFAQAEIARLEDLRVAAVEERVDADLALGRHADLIGELEALISENRHRERLRGQLMLALYRSGRQAEALEAYQQARHALVDELGIDPSGALQRLEKAILVQDEALNAPARLPKVAAPVGGRTRRRRLLGASGALLLTAGIASAFVLVTRYSAGPALVPVNSVGIIDPRTNKVIGHVQVGSRPEGVAVGRGTVWVANLEDRTLSRVDSTRRVLERTISLNATPTGVAVGAGAVWVAHGLLGTLSRVAPQYNRVSRTIQTPVAPFGETRGSVIVGAGDVWVVFADSSLFRVDPSSMRIVATMFAENSPSAIAFGNGALWIANLRDNTVTRFNPPTFARTATISVGRSPSGVAVGGGAVWVTDKADDAVSRIDPSTNSATTIPVGRAPVGIDYGIGAVWVANSGDGTVSRIDPSTNTVATIRVGNSPLGIAVGGGAVWVTVQAPRQAT
jgi:YVTN family beta-propeller protein